MRKVAIVQARMGSQRLPGKVLGDLDGAPMLKRQLDRLKSCQGLSEVALATTVGSADDAIAALGKAEGVRVFRGSEHDVLARFVDAAKAFEADVIIRLTADCPLLCPEICDTVIECLAGADYASNTIRRTYPRGLDCEAMTRETLERVADSATSSAAREHVTWHLNIEAPGRYHRVSVEDGEDWSALRWTVDQAEDMAMVRRLWTSLDLTRTQLRYRDILAFVISHPEIVAINAQVDQRHF